MNSGSDANEPHFKGRQRAGWLVGVAGPLARGGWEAESIADVLGRENDAKCDPPLALEELQRLAADAVNWATDEGHRSAALGRFLATWRVPLLDDGEIEALPPPGWLVEDVLPARGLTVLYGPPGVGKTFIALDIALCIQTGAPWQGHPVQMGKVVYIVGEGGAGISRRVRAWKQLAEVTKVTGMLFHCGSLDLLQRGHVDQFIERLTPAPLQLVVVDTLARCMVGGDEDSAKDMGTFIDALERIRTALNCAVVVLHHPTKNGPRERGSGALRGAVDMVACLDPIGEGLISMKCEKQKDAEEFPTIYVSLRSVELPDGSTSCAVVWGLPPQRAAAGDESDGKREGNGKDSAILKVLADCPAGMTPTQIRAQLPDVAERTVHRRLKRLLTDKRVVAAKGTYRLSPRETSAASGEPFEDGSGSGTGSDSDT